MHGDFLYENIKNIPTETNQLDSNMEMKFSEALKNQDVIFIGYNGADESIMNVISKVRRDNKFTIYWCDLDENKLHWRVVKLLNEFEDSYFIRIRNFDDFIFELFNQSPINSRIDLVKKAKVNESKMKTYLDSFYKKRFKRSHKICPEKYAPINEINSGLGLEFIQKIERNSLTMDEVVKYYRIIAELNPNTEWVINNFGISLMKNDSYVEALNIIEEGIKINPHYPLFWYNLGIIYHDTDRLDDALIAFAKVTELDDKFAEAFNNLAATYNSKRDYKNALIFIEKAINIEPVGKFLVNKGIILKNNKLLTEAIKFYDEAIEKGEDLVEAYLNKSNALRLLKSYDLAEEFSLKALELDTTHEYIYATLAEIYAEKGDLEKFYYYLLEALKRNYPLWRHIDDRAFVPYRKEERFSLLLKEYCPINT